MLLQKLQERGILTQVQGQYLFVSLDGQEQVDSERIRFSLQDLPQELCQRITDNFLVNVPCFTVNHSSNHWSYCSNSSTSRKRNIFSPSPNQQHRFFAIPNSDESISGLTTHITEEESIDTAILEQVQRENVPITEQLQQFQQAEQQRFRPGKSS